MLVKIKMLKPLSNYKEGKTYEVDHQIAYSFAGSGYAEIMDDPGKNVAPTRSDVAKPPVKGAVRGKKRKK